MATPKKKAPKKKIQVGKAKPKKKPTPKTRPSKSAKGSYQAWLKSKRGKAFDKRTKKKVAAATMTYQGWLQSAEGKAFNKKTAGKVRRATSKLKKK
tara:strand:- start:3197 stop:3484 length:288 start_codon:yes stop_codon:yes gene_type:complete